MLIACVPLGAQWLTYPTPGVPRTKDGKPNLTAAAPKTADGHPDLSGIWRTEENRPCGNDCRDLPIGQEFLNIAWKLPGGLPYQPAAAELLKQRKENNAKDSPHARCLPPGIVRLHTEPLFRKVLQMPGLLMILSEHNSSYRQIFTDGRPLPEDPQPAFNGYSVAHWEGDALVVETIGMKDDLWLDSGGNPLSEAARLTERFRRPNFGTLQVELTVNDPKMYTKPWSVVLTQTLVADTELMDYTCLENERSTQHLVGK